MTTEEINQLKRDHDALQAEVKEFRGFYGTDRLRDLGVQFDDLKKTTRWTAYVQLFVSAVTPLLTLYIAMTAYNATNRNEAEKARVERTKLAADLYSKALADGSPSVLLNTANLTNTLLGQDPTFAKALTGVLNTLAQRQSEVAPLALSTARATPAIDSVLRRQQQQRIQQLQQNADLPKRTVGAVAQKLSREAVRTLGRSRKQADSLSLMGYHALAIGEVANAQYSFAKADLAYPGLGSNYELSRYLHTYRTRNRPANGPLTYLQPSQQREVVATVLQKYAFGLPNSLRHRLVAQAALSPATTASLSE